MNFFISARTSSSRRRRQCRRHSVSAAAIRTRTQRSPLTATERDHAIGGGPSSGLVQCGGLRTNFQRRILKIKSAAEITQATGLQRWKGSTCPPPLTPSHTMGERTCSGVDRRGGLQMPSLCTAILTAIQPTLEPTPEPTIVSAQQPAIQIQSTIQIHQSIIQPAIQI